MGRLRCCASNLALPVKGAVDCIAGHPSRIQSEMETLREHPARSRHHQWERRAEPPRREGRGRRADVAWERAGLTRLTFHDCRHTFASLMIAAGVNAKALSSYLGHASIEITFDRYGHLMPGNEAEAAGLMGAYLERASG
jgi:integrase